MSDAAEQAADPGRLVSATKDLLDHLATQPKHAQLDSLWRDCRAALDEFTGTKTPSGRVAGDEHPDYRKEGVPNVDLAGAVNPGKDLIDKKGKGKGGWK